RRSLAHLPKARCAGKSASPTIASRSRGARRPTSDSIVPPGFPGGGVAQHPFARPWTGAQLMARPALILVDVINSFFVAGMHNFYPEAAEVLAPLSQLLAAARRSGAIVVHAVERHHPGFDDFEWRKLPQHHFAGGEDATFYRGFEPAGPHEIVVPKRRYSAFFATDLALFLREQQVSEVVIAGVKTNVCIRATAQDAFANGFDVIVPREATNSNRPHLAAASLEDIDRYFGKVVPLAEALGALT